MGVGGAAVGMGVTVAAILGVGVSDGDSTAAWGVGVAVGGKAVAVGEAGTEVDVGDAVGATIGVTLATACGPEATPPCVHARQTIPTAKPPT